MGGGLAGRNLLVRRLCVQAVHPLAPEALTPYLRQIARIHVFADECGNFDFSRGVGASKYFILATLTTVDPTVGYALLELRRALAWQGLGLNSEFHASTDAQVVRDAVFGALGPHQFRVDATILQKAKAQPSIRDTDEHFYKMAWYLHMKYLAPRVVQPSDELFVVGASLGTKKRRSVFHTVIAQVIHQVSPTTACKVACWAAASDPCLQVADYCAWAIQRKWESGDGRSHQLISAKIASEFDVFQSGTVEHY